MSSDDRIKGFAAGIFEIAKAEGELDKVKGELLTVARAFETSNELRDALSDPRLPSERKQAIVDDLLGSRSSQLTVGIVGFIVGTGNAASFPAIVDALADSTAAASNREVAEIRTAIELDEETVARITAALEKATGKKLESKVVVDPSVIGGIVARVGDTVIDGSIQRRLSSLRQAIKAR